MNNRVTGI